MATYSPILGNFDAGQVVTLVDAGGTQQAFIAGAPVSPTSFLPIAIFVDPQNVSGVASNTNTGQTASNVPPGSGPILTTAENNSRMNVPGRTLTGSLIITYLSEDLANEGVNFGLLDRGAFDLTFNLPLVSVFVGTTITGVTAINPGAGGGGQRERLQVADFTDWSPFVPSFHTLGGTSPTFLRLRDLTIDSTAWIMGFESGEVSFGHLSRPVNTAVTNATVFVVGNAYDIVRPGRLPVSVAPGSPGSGIVTFNNATIHQVGLAVQVPNTSSAAFAGAGVFFNHCTFDGALLFGATFSDCTFADGFQGMWIGTFIAGGACPNSSTDEMQGVMNFGGDFYLAGDSGFNAGAGFVSTAFLFSQTLTPTGGATPDGGMQCQSIGANVANGAAGFSVWPGASLFLSVGLSTATPVCWGNLNDGSGVLLLGPAQLMTDDPFSFAVTGTGGDFAFVFRNTRFTSAQAFDPTAGPAGAYTTPITCTWAHYQATILAGGFNGGAHLLQSGASIASVT